MWLKSLRRSEDSIGSALTGFSTSKSSQLIARLPQEQRGSYNPHHHAMEPFVMQFNRLPQGAGVAKRTAEWHNHDVIHLSDPGFTGRQSSRREI
ncbi:MAG: hypothetical protein JST61_08645 [Acidobacteria bacterium]|nr:hypothetical protein [Acidobacteriota bacterium]